MDQPETSKSAPFSRLDGAVWAVSQPIKTPWFALQRLPASQVTSPARRLRILSWFFAARILKLAPDTAFKKEERRELLYDMNQLSPSRIGQFGNADNISSSLPASFIVLSPFRQERVPRIQKYNTILSYAWRRKTLVPSATGGFQSYVPV